MKQTVGELIEMLSKLDLSDTLVNPDGEDMCFREAYEMLRGPDSELYETHDEVAYARLDRDDVETVVVLD